MKPEELQRKYGYSTVENNKESNPVDSPTYDIYIYTCICATVFVPLGFPCRAEGFSFLSVMPVNWQASTGSCIAKHLGFPGRDCASESESESPEKTMSLRSVETKQ